MKFLKQFSLCKVDERTHRISGMVTAARPDHEGEVCNYGFAKQAYTTWSNDAYAATSATGADPSYGNIRLQHGLTIAGKVVTFPEFRDVDQSIWIETEPVDDKTFDLAKRGFIKSFSQGGDYAYRKCIECGTPIESGRKCPTCKKTVLIEYGPVISEVSYVDSGCLKDANFSLVKADGTAEQTPFVSAGESFLHKLDEYHEFVKIQATELAKWQAPVSESEPLSAAAPIPSYDLAEVSKTLTDQVLEQIKKSKPDEGGTPMSAPASAFTSEQMAELTKSVAAQVMAKLKEEEAAKLAKSVKYLATESDGTTHLPYTDADGKPDHRLMGAAWAALHGGYRGNKYEGPDKDKAIARLKEIYSSEGMDTPDAKAEKCLKGLVKLGLLKHEKPADGALKKYWDCCSPIGSTDMYAIAQFAGVLDQIYWLLQQCELEAEFEDGSGDPKDAKVADSLRANLTGLIETFKDMVDEGTAELVEKSDTSGLLLKFAGNGFQKATLIDQLLSTSILQ